MPNPDIIPFAFDSALVRVVLDDAGDSWFCAKDVAKALQYPETTLANMPRLCNHVPEEWKGRYRIPTLGGPQDILCLSEQGLYFFLGRSDKPRALPFQKWLAGEVLPSIRKTGSYILPGVAAAGAALLAAQGCAIPDVPEMYHCVRACGKGCGRMRCKPPVWTMPGLMLPHNGLCSCAV